VAFCAAGAFPPLLFSFHFVGSLHRLAPSSLRVLDTGVRG
jgi:hypothetical protein